MKSEDIFTKVSVTAICTGPAGTILGVVRYGHLLQFSWKDDGKELMVTQSLGTNAIDVRYVCYVEHNDMVVFSHACIHTESVQSS